MQLLMERIGVMILLGLYVGLIEGAAVHHHPETAATSSETATVCQQNADRSESSSTLRTGHVCALCVAGVHASTLDSCSFRTPARSTCGGTLVPPVAPELSEFFGSLSRVGPPAWVV
ncbi:MAG: hypothetical protein AABY75_08560 [Bacteroidota bacterium]